MTTLIVDGNNMFYRAAYGFSDMHADRQDPNVFGFLRMLVNECFKREATSVIVCWDGGTPAYRKELLPEYKAKRHHEEDPELKKAFFRQLDTVRRVLPAMGLVSVKVEGREADDLMYHASRVVADKVIIVTTDHDLYQAITSDGRVSVWNPRLELLISADNFMDVICVPLDQWLDYRTLVGDKSDNIVGVPGIGEKLAKEILTIYPSLDIAWYYLQQGQWKAKPLSATRLNKVSKSRIDNVRHVMDLAVEDEEARAAILNRVDVWTEFEKGTVKRFLYSKDLVELMSGMVSLKKVFLPLEQPKLQESLQPSDGHTITIKVMNGHSSS